MGVSKWYIEILISIIHDKMSSLSTFEWLLKFG
jgi:hypothetical protein